jgi:hypothetical protein
MNAERLNAIALALRDELADTEAAALLDQLVMTLRQVVQEPSQPSHQQSASSLRQRLDAGLAAAPSNDFSPAWREAVEELGVADLLGERLRERVNSIFERNEITPSAAADDLTKLNERMQGLTEALDNLVAAFDFLVIGAEELSAGEFEVGFLVPRPAVKEELGTLGKEFIELKGILNPFLELTTGGRPDLRVRSIASSDFQVLLDSAPATALLLATALERLISSYEKVVNIRLAYKQLRESGASEETLASVKNDAEARMETDTEALAEELVRQADHVQEERANELRTELRNALNALANRIDRGYSVEVRAGEAEEPDEDGEEPDAEAQRLREQTERVLAAQKRLSFRNPTGEPILRLPEGPLDPGEPEPVA